MKAPDKIYVDDLAVVNDFSTKVSVRPLLSFSEYIRKDMLLEWAKEHKMAIEVNGDEDDAYTRGEYDIINSLIDKLNEK